MPPFLPGALARNLRDGHITERQKLFYVVLMLFLQAAVHFVSSISQRIVWASLLYSVINLVGIFLAFRTNARGDNRAFIERWLCLQTSLSILVVYIPQFLLYCAYVASYWTYGSRVIGVWQRASPIAFLVTIFLVCLQYALLNHFIRIASSGTGSLEEKPFAPIAAP